MGFKGVGCLKVLSLCSGIGAFEKALSNLGIKFDLINYCEIDKMASKSYSLIHNVNEDKNLSNNRQNTPYLYVGDECLSLLMLNSIFFLFLMR